MSPEALTLQPAVTEVRVAPGPPFALPPLCWARCPLSRVGRAGAVPQAVHTASLTGSPTALKGAPLGGTWRGGHPLSRTCPGGTEPRSGVTPVLRRLCSQPRFMLGIPHEARACRGT